VVSREWFAIVGVVTDKFSDQCAIVSVFTNNYLCSVNFSLLSLIIIFRLFCITNKV